MRAILFLVAAVGCAPGADAPDDDTDAVDTAPAATDDTDAVETDETDDTEVVDTDPPVTRWNVVASGLGPALLSITGRDVNDVWAVGAADDDGPLVIHYDGTAWRRIPVGGTTDLWWVWAPVDGDVWMVGVGGRVVRWDGTEAHEEVLDPAVTLFGVWGTSPDDVWAVGGNIAVASGGATVFHRDASGWSRAELPAEVAARLAVYKVWGTSPDDVWACGDGGTMMRFDGEAWTSVPSGTTRTLFTVSGSGRDAVVAVGGSGSAAVVAWDGTAWTDESPRFAPAFNGVSARGGAVVAAGRTGAVWWRRPGGWEADARGPATDLDLHAVWLDPEGAPWAVGGQIASAPLRDGVLVYGGARGVPQYPAPAR